MLDPFDLFERTILICNTHRPARVLQINPFEDFVILIPACREKNLVSTPVNNMITLRLEGVQARSFIRLRRIQDDSLSLFAYSATAFGAGKQPGRKH
jgi:hypothetical protein